MSSTVTLQINSQRLIKNLMFSFTNKTTFLSELMQNARRAGATFVRFSFDEVWPNTLVVEDDGAGIANLQNLLTIAESGWDETIQAQENPFGMGFMSALFAAQRITVHSNGKRLSFDRDEAVEQKPIVVEYCPTDDESPDVSTRIELYGIGLNLADVKSAIETAAQGFAINVFFNGKECRRPFAWDNLMHNTSSLYDAVLSLPNLGGIAFSNHSTDFEVYLLGNKVYQSRKYAYFGNLSTIIHLDPALFMARLPDRQCLIDEDTAVETIKRMIRSWWTQHIEPQIGVISDEVLISKYWTVLTQWDLPDVLTQIKAIPANYFCKYTDTPMCNRSDGDYRNNNMDDLDGKLVTEEQLRSGELIACHNTPDSLHGYNMIPALIAYLKGWIILKRHLPSNHWIHDYALDLAEKKSADSSAFSLSRALSRFIEWRESNLNSPDLDPCLKRINILAHSMGNRVLRETLCAWDKYDLADGVPLLFRNSFLIAADIENESIHRNERAKLICDASRNVVVYFASDDLALRASKAANLKNNIASRRLGHTGPENMELTPKNVYVVDCDDVNNAYDTPKGHSYFRSGRKTGKPGLVFEHIYTCLKSGRVFPEDEMRRSTIIREV